MGPNRITTSTLKGHFDAPHIEIPQVGQPRAQRSTKKVALDLLGVKGNVGSLQLHALPAEQPQLRSAKLKVEEPASRGTVFSFNKVAENVLSVLTFSSAARADGYKFFEDRHVHGSGDKRPSNTVLQDTQMYLDVKARAPYSEQEIQADIKDFLRSVDGEDKKKFNEQELPAFQEALSQFHAKTLAEVVDKFVVTGDATQDTKNLVAALREISNLEVIPYQFFGETPAFAYRMAKQARSQARDTLINKLNTSDQGDLQYAAQSYSVLEERGQVFRLTPENMADHQKKLTYANSSDADLKKLDPRNLVELLLHSRFGSGAYYSAKQGVLLDDVYDVEFFRTHALTRTEGGATAAHLHLNELKDELDQKKAARDAVLPNYSETTRAISILKDLHELKNQVTLGEKKYQTLGATDPQKLELLSALTKLVGNYQKTQNRANELFPGGVTPQDLPTSIRLMEGNPAFKEAGELDVEAKVALKRLEGATRAIQWVEEGRNPY